MNLSTFQRLMLINAHPIKMTLNSIGGIGALYLLWDHRLIPALIIGSTFIALGSLLSTQVFPRPSEYLARQLLGKMFLRYTRPAGFACYLVSHALIPIAFWLHDTLLIALGLLILACGMLELHRKPV